MPVLLQVAYIGSVELLSLSDAAAFSSSFISKDSGFGPISCPVSDAFHLHKVKHSKHPNSS